MNEINKRLQQINMENKIWIIYLIIIFLSYYSNDLEKNFLLCNDIKKKEEYRRIIIFIFTVLVIIYLYFFLDNYNSIKDLDTNITNKEKELNELSLFASGLILLSGIIFLYIAIVDKNASIELAFN